MYSPSTQWSKLMRASLDGFPRFIVCACIAMLLSNCTADTDQTNGEDLGKSKTAEDSESKPVDESGFTLLSESHTNIKFNNALREDPLTFENPISFQYYQNGAGLCVGDLNNDELPDIFFCGNNVSNALYINKGNLKFQDVTEKAGLKSNRFAHGATLVDLNNDGFLDIYVSNGGPYQDPQRANQFYENNGDGTFTEKAKSLGIDDMNWTIQSAFFDYDKDGDLDLICSNHAILFNKTLEETVRLLSNPSTLDKSRANFFINENGKFRKATEEVGMGFYGYGLGLVVSDINQDNWPDIYIANDYAVPDFMYINQKNGKFKNVIKEQTNQISYWGMGCDIADFNNDGAPDIAVVDMASADHVMAKTLMKSMDSDLFWGLVNELGYPYQYMYNALQLNNGTGVFSNIAQSTGFGASEWSWSVLFGDVDNDGWKDCFVSNGVKRNVNDNDWNLVNDAIPRDARGMIPQSKKAEVYQRIPNIPLSNLLYHNSGDYRFDKKLLGPKGYSHGAALADLDLDGDLDLVVNNMDAAASVFRNNATGNYLQIKLTGKEEEKLFAKVEARSNGNVQYQEYIRTRGYQSAIDAPVHFGLGNVKKVDSLIVKWIDGSSDLFTGVKANQVFEVKKGSGKRLSPKAKRPTLFKKRNPKSLGIDFVHKENEYDDFKKEVLLPHRQSRLGPALAAADVNGDGEDDFFIGGAAGQSGKLFRRNGKGFVEVNGPWEKHANQEAIVAHFFDANGDGNLDLLIGYGGGEFVSNDEALQDRLYLADGRGGFKEAKDALPSETNTGALASADFDGDGDQDLFIGAMAVPGEYPHPQGARFFSNNGQGKFQKTDAFFDCAQIDWGLIKDVKAIDIEGDGDSDLIIVGEWMAPVLLENQDGKFIVSKRSKSFEKLSGWYHRIHVEDLDEDGRIDIVFGNNGSNMKFKSSEQKPLLVYSSDFDSNGQNDIVLGQDYKGEYVPVRGRECSSEQMPTILNEFPSYSEFAKADLKEIYGAKKMDEALKLSANEFRSFVAFGDEEGFEIVYLPREAQFAPITGIAVKKVASDGRKMLCFVGNNYETEPETPRYDAGQGWVFELNNRSFQSVSPEMTGLFVRENVRNMIMLKGVENAVLIAPNDQSPLYFSLEF